MQSLDDLIDDDNPFGPTTLDEIEDEGSLRALYSADNRIHAASLRRKPGFVVGRRGGGKTAALGNLILSNPGFTCQLETSSTFGAMATLIEDLKSYRRFMHLDQTSHIWEAALWHPVLGVLQKLPGCPREVIDYLSGLVPNPRAASPEGLLSRFTIEFLAQATDSSTLVADQVNLFYARNLFLEDALASAKKWMQDTECWPILILDSTEDFHNILADSPDSTAGLFNLVGRRARRPKITHRNADLFVAMSMPAELWHAAQDYSYNHLKDFENIAVLHWHPRELTMIAAKRLQYYLSTFHNDFFAKKIRKHSADVPKGATNTLMSCLPETVTNGFGIEEPTLTYILRHTQLLPRHLLLLLNSIWRNNQTMTGSSTKITSASVLHGVKAVEGKIVSEIAAAYGAIWPRVDDLCRRLIPTLPMSFTDGELHHAFNGVRGDFSDEYPDVHRFRRMVIEVGIVGRLIDDDGIYAKAEFEYTRPNQLNLGQDEQLCLHPLFAGVYGAKGTKVNESPLPGMKPIYPYGCGLEDDDYRGISWT